MDVTEYQGELTRAHWDLLLDADPHFDAVLAYTPPQHGEAEVFIIGEAKEPYAMCVICLLYTSPSPRDRQKSRMPSSA